MEDVDLVHELELDIRSCLRVTEFVFAEPSLNEFLSHVLIEAMHRVGADRGSIFLLDRLRKTLVGFAMTGIERPSDVSLPAGHGIVGHVVSSGETLNIRDAYADPRFFAGVDKQTGYRTRAVLCLPIRAVGGAPREAFGAMELLNPKTKEAFDEHDVRSIENVLSFATVRLREYSLIESLLASHQRLEKEVARMRGYEDESSALREFVGVSEAIERLKHLIWSVAPYDSSVLISGESGTGKELVARSLHALSARRKAPFVALNCAAVPETLLEAELFGIESGVATGVSKRMGRIEQAQGGTLFLDEIGEMPPVMQAKLLRVIQEREVVRVGGKDPISIDVRFLAATHRALDRLIEEGRFREDLFYRLKVVQIDVPALRERREDIPFLARHFLDRLNERYGAQPPRSFSPEILRSFESADWPGNVRQLQNEVERLFILAGTGGGLIRAEDPLRQPVEGPPAVSARVAEGVDADNGVLSVVMAIEGDSLASVLARVEKTLVMNALAKHEGNRTRAAEELGISREGLRKMLLRWGEHEPKG